MRIEFFFSSIIFAKYERARQRAFVLLERSIVRAGICATGARAKKVCTTARVREDCDRYFCIK